MAIKVNNKGVSHAKSLIKEGKVDKTSDWSFDAEDGNKILGDGNWSEYAKWFLAIDTEANEETKERYKFPYGKNGKVYRRGVIAAKQRAAQHGYDNIVQVADELLQMIDKEEKTFRLPVQTRTYQIRQSDIDRERRTVALSFSSEEPVERWYGMEILDHSEGAVDLSRLKKIGALLINHDPRDQVGVIEDVYLDQADRKGRAIVRFGRSAKAEEVFQDVLDGIRKNVSVGYLVKEMKFEKHENGKDYYRVTRWVPIEISLVSIPADATVGIGRNLETEVRVIKEETLNLVKEEKREETRQDNKKIEERRVKMEEIRKEVLEQEQKRVAEILAIGEAHNCLDLAKKAIAEGRSVDEFKGIVLETVYKARKQEVIDPRIGMSEKEARQFSIVRAINALANHNWNLAPFEKEASDAVAKRIGKEPHGFYIPYDVMTTPLVSRRDLEKGTPSAGGYTVATELLAAEFIELLRNAMMVRKLGARILSGLVGDIAIPKQTGGATAYWVGESMAPTESQQTFGQLGLSPKTVGAYTDISRKLLLQSSIDVEAFVRQDLTTILALAIDFACINGTGSSYQPTGILNTTGIGLVEIDVNGGAPTYEHIVKLWKEVAQDNALVGSLGFLTNAIMIAKLSRTPKVPGYPVFVIEDLPGQDGMTTMLGLPCAMSNQVPSNLVKGTSNDCSAIIFGNWADLIIAQWGAIDVMVDPYTGGAAGTVRVRVLQDIDIGIRHPESFAAIKDARDV
jgi:HK97 family phage major capsid protein